jgi:hypothetical protein
MIAGSAFVLGKNKFDSSSVSVKIANNANKPLYLALAKSPNDNFSNPMSNIALGGDDEDTVIINVSNFGRSNPFKPYVENSLLINGPSYQNPLINVPPPPEYNPDPNFTTLFGVKVSGILYDVRRPSAIVNVDKNDYLVHEGDYLFNFYVYDITSDKVAIKYRNNIYRAGIGEVIEGIVNVNPVQSKKMFAGSGYKPATSSIKLVNPVNLPTLPTL